MAMSLQDIRDFVRTHMDLEEEDLPDPVLDVFIREGSRKVEYSEQRWPFYEMITNVASVAGFPFLPLPSDVRHVVSLTLDNKNLEWRSMEELQEQPSNQGTPRYFTVWGSALTLYPTPETSETLVLRYYRKARDWMTGGAGATPDCPEELHNTIAMWALHRSYAQQEDPQMAAFYRNIFDQELNELGRRIVEMPLVRPLILNADGIPGFRRGRPRFDWE